MAQYPFKDYADLRVYAPILAYSPDGRQIAHVTSESGQFNLWTMPTGGGERRQLTHYTDNTVRAVDWSADGKHIVFLADANGDEFRQIYIMDAVTGETRPVRHAEKTQHSSIAVSHDCKWLVYAANDRAPGDVDTQIYNFETGEHQRLTEGKLMYPGRWSPDDRYIPISDVRGNTDLDLLVYDMQAGELRMLVKPETPAIVAPAAWSADSQWLYFVTNIGREFNGLARIRVSGDGAWDYVLTPDWDIEQAVMLPKSDRMVYVVNEDGASVLHGYDFAAGGAFDVPVLPYGVVGAMTPNHDGSRLALTMNRPVEASNLYEIDLAAGTLTGLGESMLGGIPTESMVEPELIHFDTFDGRKIPAWLYRPRTSTQPGPALLSIHGGPESQERPVYAYNGFYQYLVDRGFTVLAPNIRGSTGYGISYQKLIHRDFGGDDLKDIEHAAKYLQSLASVDPNRIAVFGGSYGGFATLSAVTRLPQYWAAGVDLVGPSNLVTFARAVPPFWKRMMKEWVGDPDEDHDMLMERSPITYVKNVRAPMLIIQGANDPRVVKSESDQMVEQMKANGVRVKYYVDEAEGHGTTRRENMLTWYSMVTEFLTDELLDEPV
ncbi:MAG: S9 family peptidase [Chloroflexi bacterium]|nr:MAG: putative S9 family peptidase [Chloroflexi bacterium OLB13]MBC6957137.1 S9 family peptidase [Chloroflexota bacterium]MCO6445871.1 S9 family peptidase [Anaerolineae bacterium]MDL1917050.1 S9 family peptidase [Anaerolineae bacterium CFX4]MCC6566969.1 S9 family peptidase [Chloroflexota bacterium]